jgi:hypothetical protein
MTFLNFMVCGVLQSMESSLQKLKTGSTLVYADLDEIFMTSWEHPMRKDIHQWKSNFGD